MSFFDDSRHVVARITALLLALALAASPAWATDDDDELISQEFLLTLVAGADPQALAERKQLELRESLPTLRLYLYFDPLAREPDSFAAEHDPRARQGNSA